MRKFLILLAAGSSFIGFAASNAVPAEAASGSTPATAAEAKTAPASGAPHPVAGAAITQVRPSGQPIVLEAGKGTLIRLPKAAATVFIANPDIADVQVKSPELIYLSGKAPGDTVVYAVDAEDNVLLHSPVRVDHDLTRLRQSMRYLMPGEDIAVSSVDGALVLSGKVSTAGRAEKARALAAALTTDIKGAHVVNDLAVTTPNQINLRVKIAEVNRSVLKALGVNWARPAGNGSNLKSQVGGAEFNTDNPVTGGQIANQNTIVGIFGAQGARISATFDALAQEGLITTLAEPNLTAMNGQTASFLAGGEFPVPVAAQPASSNGSPVTGSQITVEFKTFGVSLDFTPTIVDATHVNLKIRPEVSQLSTNGAVTVSGFSIPALTVRRAETTVELGSGQSFALAGLLENNSEQDISKIPWLGDIPILGQLFRSDRFQHNESELVIIVTPYLVTPSNIALSAPTDGFVPPHDSQRVINSETYRQGLPGPAKGPVGPGGQGLIGPVGFRID